MKAGRLKIVPAAYSGGRDDFAIQCQPHVAIKLRRMFGGIQRTREVGVFRIAATPGHAYELDWFRKLHPLDIDADSKRRFGKLLRAEKKRLEAIAAFDDEGYVPKECELAIPLRQYQKVAVDMAITTRNLLLGDALGIGKTATCIGMLVAPGSLPALFVALTHLPEQIEREINRFAPQLVTHRIRQGTPYEFGKKGELVTDPETGKRVRKMFPAKPDVLIINYNKLDGWAETLAGKVQTVIFDEIQELRHPGTDKYKAAKGIAKLCDLRIGASATPIYNYGAEIYAVLDVIAPDALGSWKEFLDEWCSGASAYTTDRDAKKIKVADPTALGSYLRESGLMLRRTRKDVGRELPPLTIVRHVVEADTKRIDQVATDVRELAQRVLDRLGTPFDRMQWSRDIDYQMRQATGIAKAPAIADFVRLLVESGEQVLLGLWHHECYDIVESKLAASVGDLKIACARFTGQESTKEKAESMRRFVAGEVPVLMMSNRAGAGIDGLQKVCHTVVIGELDWSPKVHDQFIGRADRDGQEVPVTAYYLVAMDGSDPVIADVLGIKSAQSKGIVDPYDSDDAVLVGAPEDRIRKLAEDVLARAPVRPSRSPKTGDGAAAVDQATHEGASA